MRTPAEKLTLRSLRSADWSFTVCALLIVTLGTMMVTFVTQTSFGQAGPAPDHAASVEMFNRIATVLEHQRCMNCHTSTDFPRQGDDGHPHIMNVKRGPNDTGVAALQCATCHQGANSPAGVPGNEVWHLAPLSMAWEGLTVGEICRSLTDPRKGAMTPQQLITHMGEDHLVAWAWDAGVDLEGRPRQAPPIPHAEFGELVKQWVATGAACPQ